ncbi:hypothetical protein H8356DRAFT_1355195 [Neocallimastix lanati (nom. inval.)]|nr:hypothetical protein H8356DRAFT_1355195 [Neocallimastix sp. JGI-2020a]
MKNTSLLFELTNANEIKKIKERKTSRFSNVVGRENVLEMNCLNNYIYEDIIKKRDDRAKFKRVRNSTRFVYDLNVTDEMLRDEAHAKRDKFQCLYLFLNMEYSKSILQKSRDEKVEDIKDKLENKKYHMEEDLTYSYY